MDTPNAAAEVGRRKRLISLVSIAGIVPLVAILEAMRRGILLPPLVWGIVASALILGHMVWALSLMRCPGCRKFVRGMLNKPACPHCGAAFV